ncbi:tryptophan-rich sensory protein TspO [Oceaniglobus roseus]|uniref:tryptophan-rich sensory protein TspO n=1 Tax=Oceaniglobus roseus TaxID=1737570 RepID=UPI000C7F1EFC|nr:TspO/MBR family protein [Kandeliimicrobium roseum]
MDWTLFAIFFASCGAAAATGAMFQPGAWYESLNKPRWTPPDWVFPVTWTTLYILMSWAATRVAMGYGNDTALALWGLQIGLNTLWTPVFFGLNRMRAAFVVIVFLWIAVALTLLAFWSVDPLAGILFVPYLVWVTIAGALNWSVWRMNPDEAR